MLDTTIYSKAAIMALCLQYAPACSDPSEDQDGLMLPCLHGLPCVLGSYRGNLPPFYECSRSIVWVVLADASELTTAFITYVSMRRDP